MMQRLPREQWPPHHFLTTVLLFCVVSSELVFLCLFLAPSTPGRVIKTVYLMTLNGSVDALQASTGSIRWHHQFDQQNTVIGSLLADTHVVYVGRVNPIYSRHGQQSYTGSVDALKASDGTVLWHHPIDAPNGMWQSVQVMRVIGGVVYVGADGCCWSLSDGDVYALRADTGSLLWHYKVRGYCCHGLVVTKTAIYIGVFGEGASHVDALRTSDGSLLWHHWIDSPSNLWGIAGADGVVYVGTVSWDTQDAIDALRASDGSRIWTWHSQMNGGPFLLTVADNRVYASTWDNTLSALRVRNGSLIWQDKNEGLPFTVNEGLPLLAMDGVVYVMTACFRCSLTRGSKFDALRASDGTALWRYHIPPGAFLWGGEVDYGTVYLIVPHGIVALQATSGKQRWLHAVDDDIPLALTAGA